MPNLRPSWRAAILVVLAFVAGCTPRGTEATAEAREAAVAPVPLEDGMAEIQQARGVAVGAGDAPVELHEFSDFQCPACANFAAVAAPYIKERYVEPGVVRYVRYDFPLVNRHPNAFLAARAGRCAADQERYWLYHDVLYQQQDGWSGVEAPAELFIEYADIAGLDRALFESCLLSDRHAVEVTRNLRLGEALGVPGTPTIFINGQRVQLRTMEDLDRMIQQQAGLQ